MYDLPVCPTCGADVDRVGPEPEWDRIDDLRPVILPPPLAWRLEPCGHQPRSYRCTVTFRGRTVRYDLHGGGS